MKHAISILILAFLLAFAGWSVAQNKRNTGKPVKHETPPNTRKRLLIPQLYLGGEFMGGKITTKEFERLMRKGVTARDSMGRSYKVIGFNVDFYEHMLYEDESGNSMIVTDRLSEFCLGDTLSHTASSLYNRIKAGDTVAFDQVVLAKIPAITRFDTISGKGFVCSLVK